MCGAQVCIDDVLFVYILEQADTPASWPITRPLWIIMPQKNNWAFSSRALLEIDKNVPCHDAKFIEQHVLQNKVGARGPCHFSQRLHIIWKPRHLSKVYITWYFTPSRYFEEAQQQSWMNTFFMQQTAQQCHYPWHNCNVHSLQTKCVHESHMCRHQTQPPIYS